MLCVPGWQPLLCRGISGEVAKRKFMGYTGNMLYLGASGFSYDDWVGSFYPAGMPKREWLTRIRKLDSVAEKTFIFANNHWRAQAVGTIRQLALMLD